MVTENPLLGSPPAEPSPQPTPCRALRDAVTEGQSSPHRLLLSQHLQGQAGRRSLSRELYQGLWILFNWLPEAVHEDFGAK